MDFKTHLQKYLSTSDIDSLMAEMEKPWWNGLFLNPRKLSNSEFLVQFPNVIPHPIIKNAFIYHKEEYALGKNILHDLGAYYIQEPSAMLVANLLDPQEDDVILDLCAAPGGKTIAASILMNNKGLIVSNDLSYPRALTLSQNVERLGCANIVVTSFDINQANMKLNNLFTKIILDAPCSGSSMFRKEPKMRDDWSYEKVLRCAKIQINLLHQAFEMLKSGGEIIYSTCSFSYEENEEVIIEFLKTHPDATLEAIPHIPGEYRPLALPQTVRLFPHLFIGEGHFIAKIKKGGDLIKDFTKYQEEKEPLFKKIRKDFPLQDLTFYRHESIIYGLPKHIGYLGVPTLRFGVKIAEIKHGNIAYDHALSRYLDSDRSIALNEEEINKFLRGECLNKDIENGYHLVSYQGLNIGLTKASQGILKNHYPKGLRRSISL